MLKKNSAYKHDAEAGGVEMAVVVVLFLLIILGTIYFGFFSITKSLVDAGLGRGLDLASTHPGFNDIAPTGCDPTDSAKQCCAKKSNSALAWCAAILEIETETTKIPKSGILKTESGSFAYIVPNSGAINVKMPRPLPGQNLNAAYKNTPIEITVTYQALNIYGQYVTMTRSGFIFREVPTQGAFNVTTDCNGYPEHSPQYGVEDCVCDAATGQGSAVIGGVRQCVQCSTLSTHAAAENGTFVDSDGITKPTHQTNKFYNVGGADSNCMCPTHDYCVNEYGPSSYSLSSCQCRCHMGFGGDSYSTNTECKCKGTVPAIVPTGSGWNDNGGTTPPVTFEPIRVELKLGSNYWTGCHCVLSAASQAQYGTQFLTSTMCRNWYGPTRGALNYDSCGCRCNWTNAGGNHCSGGSRNYTLCSCSCPAGKTMDGNGDCICDACPAGEILDLNFTSICKCVPDCSAAPGFWFRGPSSQCECSCPTDTFPACTDCGGAGGSG